MSQLSQEESLASQHGQIQTLDLSKVVSDENLELLIKEFVKV